MATCPKCRKHFRTLEDEEGMHECPRCGYWPYSEDQEPEPEEEDDDDEPGKSVGTTRAVQSPQSLA